MTTANENGEARREVVATRTGFGKREATCPFCSTCNRVELVSVNGNPAAEGMWGNCSHLSDVGETLEGTVLFFDVGMPANRAWKGGWT